ncbi:MAG: neutral zinc metallopeptidase [Planctomycetaceae bacterium]
MRLEGERQSENVEDRRGKRGPVLAAGGGLGTLVIILIVLFRGGDPLALLQNMQQNAPPGAQQQGPIDPNEEPLGEFV